LPAPRATPATGGEPTAITVAAAQPKAKSIAGPSPTEQERYLGGFTSGALKLKGKGLGGRIGGAGIYATTRRLLVVESVRGYFQLLEPLGGALPVTAAVVAGIDNKSAKAIAELDAKKKLEVKKADIAEILVRKPATGWVTSTIGRLNITLKSGEKVEFIIGTKEVFQSTKDLMEAFYPERLEVEE
jgi:hypothetical protein